MNCSTTALKMDPLELAKITVLTVVIFILSSASFIQCGAWKLDFYPVDNKYNMKIFFHIFFNIAYFHI